MHSCVKQIHSSSTMNKHVWGTVMGTSSRCSTLVQVRKQSLKIRKSFQSSPNFCSLDGANALATRKVVHQAVASLRSCSETLASTCPGLSHAELLSGILAAACEYVESKICSFKARPLISPATLLQTTSRTCFFQVLATFDLKRAFLSPMTRATTHVCYCQTLDSRFFLSGIHCGELCNSRRR